MRGRSRSREKGSRRVPNRPSTTDAACVGPRSRAILALSERDRENPRPKTSTGVLQGAKAITEDAAIDRANSGISISGIASLLPDFSSKLTPADGKHYRKHVKKQVKRRSKGIVKLPPPPTTTTTTPAQAATPSHEDPRLSSE